LQDSLVGGCDYLMGSLGAHVLDDEPADLLDSEPDCPSLVIAQCMPPTLRDSRKIR
jgi:hypothetical protein